MTAAQGEQEVKAPSGGKAPGCLPDTLLPSAHRMLLAGKRRFPRWEVLEELQHSSEELLEHLQEVLACRITLLSPQVVVLQVGALLGEASARYMGLEGPGA